MIRKLWTISRTREDAREAGFTAALSSELHAAWKAFFDGLKGNKVVFYSTTGGCFTHDLHGTIAHLEAAQVVIADALRDLNRIDAEFFEAEPDAVVTGAKCPFCETEMLVEPASGDSVCANDCCPGPVVMEAANV